LDTEELTLNCGVIKRQKRRKENKDIIKLYYKLQNYLHI